MSNTQARQCWRTLLVGVILSAMMFGANAMADTVATGNHDSDTPSARQLVEEALQQWRGQASKSRMRIQIHRPDWEREMEMQLWTSGQGRSLVRVLSPRSDAGTGHLLMDGGMWTYSPQVNRVVRVPGSMMSQQWLSSDFTNNEIARSDSILEDYHHEIIDERQEAGQRIYRLKLVPHDAAPVVWGRQELDVREDRMLMRQVFFDQSGERVKTLETLEVAELDDRLVAVRQRMTQADDPNRWTEVIVEEAEYNLDLPDQLFTTSNLRNPRF